MLDNLDLFSSSTAGDSVTATAASASVIPLSAHRKIGQGEPVKVLFEVTEAFTDGSSDSTVTVTLETDDDEAFGSVDATQTIGVFGALSAVGTKLEAFIQPSLITSNFLRAKYTVANGSLTTGKIFGAIVSDFQQAQDFPVGTQVG